MKVIALCRKLRRLRMHAMPHVKESQLLSLLLLDQLPQLQVDGVDYADLSQPVQTETIMPAFMRQLRAFEQRMISKMSLTSRITRFEALRLKRHSRQETAETQRQARVEEYYAELESRGLLGDDAPADDAPATEHVLPTPDASASAKTLEQNDSSVSQQQQQSIDRTLKSHDEEGPMTASKTVDEGQKLGQATETVPEPGQRLGDATETVPEPAANEPVTATTEETRRKQAM